MKSILMNVNMCIIKRQQDAISLRNHTSGSAKRQFKGNS